MSSVKPSVVCLSGSLSPHSRSERIAAWCVEESAKLGVPDVPAKHGRWLWPGSWSLLGRADCEPSATLRCWPTPLGVAVADDVDFGDDGRPAGPRLLFQLSQMLDQVMTVAALNAQRRMLGDRQTVA